MFNILADENIPLAHKTFGAIGNLSLVNGRNISPEMLKNIDVLLVRSITEVNEKLLANSNVKFVGTATIGSDHIDREYLLKRNIYFTDAKGCNSYSVMEYVYSAISRFCFINNLQYDELSLGIVGYGNIGSKVYKAAKSLGMKIKVSDPPLQDSDFDFKFSSIDEVLKCDIVTLHVPLTNTGNHPTLYMLDKEELNKLKENCLLINTSRGAVINNNALVNIIDNKKINVVLDVWENEPGINKDLLKKVFIGTPHIAGYSLEGKVNGTRMIHTELSKFLNINNKVDFSLPKIEDNTIEYDDNMSFENNLEYIFNIVYPIKEDDKKLREILGMNDDKSRLYFDELRKNYPERREFNNYIINTNNEDVIKKLSPFRFQFII